MKKFKELRHEIGALSEEHSEGGGFGYDPVLKSQGRSAKSKVEPTNYDDPYDMQKVNAFISAFTSKSYVEPKSALYLLKAKLNLTGIDFDFNRSSELEADKEYILPLKRFGGTFGTSPQHDLKNGFEVTNGFGGKNYGLKLKVIAPKSENNSGLFVINAQVIET